MPEFRKKLDDQTVGAIYRSAWVADYPSIENFLNPPFRAGGSSNVGHYSCCKTCTTTDPKGPDGLRGRRVCCVVRNDLVLVADYLVVIWAGQAFNVR